jgi:uncharacterized membrane protein YhaH (DUF805 family)
VLNYRINRPTYWASIAMFTLVVCVFVYLGKGNAGLEIMMVVTGIPRLHDIGRSGWWIGAVILAEITVVVGLMIAGTSSDTLELILAFLVLLIGLLAIWLGAIPGQAETNRWGEPTQRGIRFGRLRIS